MLGRGADYQPPDAPLSRGLEVHPHGVRPDLEIWIDRRYVPAGYGWCFPARDEMRVGVGSFDPRFHVKDTTVLLAEDLGRDAVRYQGNWIPHKLRERHRGRRLLRRRLGRPLPAAHRRGHPHGVLLRASPCGRELRAVVEGAQVARAGARRLPQLQPAHAWKFDWMLRVQKLVPRVPPRLLAPALNAMGTKAFVDWSFSHYLEIAPPSFAGPAPTPSRRAPVAAAA